MVYNNRRLRHELKFPATAAQCEILRQRFSAVMKPDKNGDNGRYRVTVKSDYCGNTPVWKYVTGYVDKNEMR